MGEELTLREAIRRLIEDHHLEDNVYEVRDEWSEWELKDFPERLHEAITEHEANAEPDRWEHPWLNDFTEICERLELYLKETEA